MMKLKTILCALFVCAQAAPLWAQAARVSPKPAAAQPVATTAQPGQTLPIRRVILYSNGVAYVERRGTVTGRAEINLSFKQSQVDDVLKSMVVLDLGQGRIGAVSYNSSAPPAARMADIPFSIDASTGASGGLAGVLSQLQGARVLVVAGARTGTGAILTVEERKEQIDAQKPAVLKHLLVLSAEGGELVSFDLSEVRSIKLLDEGTRKDITEFADATASARRRDAKTITVTSDGAGAREMVVSYTIAAPIWKTNYRVVLDNSGKPFFQGWAIVDNVSDEDWENVQLSLVSGTPVSFIQPIQKPFYRYRPVVPMPEDLKLEPQIYEPDGSGVGYGGGGPGGGGAMATVTVTAGTETLQTSSSATGQTLRQNNFMVDATVSNNIMTTNAPTITVSDAITSGASGVETAAQGGEVGDLFEYKISQPITVRRDRSALIPIVQVKMDGERTSIYNEGVRRDRPMGGMLLKNTTNLTLEAGAVTVLDGDAYAGEALMERLKPQEQRLVSFALDLGTLVTVRQKQERAPTFFVRAVAGTFQAHYYQTDQKVYKLTNQTDKARVVYIEHPVREGWELSKDTAKPASTTQRYHRFRVELGPRATVEIPVTERRALMDTYDISNFTRPQLDFFIAKGYIDARTRDALEKIIDLKVNIASVNGRIRALDAEAEEITKDQERYRENIEALSKTSEAKTLIARYIAKADAQETRLEQITKDKKAALDEQTRLQEELTKMVRGLALERNL
jgi:hypothetical protein